MRFPIHPEPASTPEQRLRTAFELYGLAERLKREQLRRAMPEASEAEIEGCLAAWRLERPGAEEGDGPGKRVPWPRR